MKNLLNYLHRNTFIVLCCFSLMLTFASCKKDACEDPLSYTYGEEGENCVEMEGCLGYNSNYSNIGSIGNTFYNFQNDNQFSQEVGRQRSFWSIPANVYVWYEPNGVKNAVSTSEGNILYGYNLFYYTVPNFGDHAVDGVLAHEWAHQIQFSYGWMNQGTLLSELEADAFAGFYIIAGKQLNTSQINGFMNNVYYSGDYQFNSSDHHGTPNQRAAAATIGINYGLNYLNGTSYTYTQLHTKIINKIMSSVLRTSSSNNEEDLYISEIAKGKRKIKEIIYPLALTPGSLIQ